MIAARDRKPPVRLRAAVVLTTFLVVAGTETAAAEPRADDDEIPGDPLIGRSVFVEKGCRHGHAI